MQQPRTCMNANFEQDQVPGTRNPRHVAKFSRRQSKSGEHPSCYNNRSGPGELEISQLLNADLPPTGHPSDCVASIVARPATAVDITDLPCFITAPQPHVDTGEIGPYGPTGTGGRTCDDESHLNHVVHLALLVQLSSIRTSALQRNTLYSPDVCSQNTGI
ncbi:hypothetical protein CERZMDRAFT_89124 [Cercospora zeae-maydis SCOH1-5]|uniref:Uncharacterized protein n=1 Tax=Cercospora zeae-maydis SCOH1-5 TaxID=717836 RepID=A0A6A6F2T3_9PEZI|nr:hypothetical protein CERZMDRAFT_89124 [Cercospora zeae-maydis SCOH1-5]